LKFDVEKLFNGREFSDRDFDAEMNKSILPPEEHSLKISIEKRRGKKVTVVGNFHLIEKEQKELLKTLKKKLSTGGTIRENSLEFQGDIKEKVSIELKNLRFKIK
jgi:translation initiation factor 1